MSLIDSESSELARGFLARIDALVADAALRLSEMGRPLSCKRGCSACCRLPVSATTPEARAALEYISMNFGDDRIQGLIGRLAEWVDWSQTGLARLVSSGMEPVVAHLYHGPGCPFLQGDDCSIYPARPMACRVNCSVRAAEDCRPPIDELPVFFTAGSVAAILEAVKPACLEYKQTLGDRGAQFEGSFGPFPRLMLGLTGGDHAVAG